MLKTLNSFTLNFLKKIDKHLLLNYPDIWATKVPHVAFWGSIYFLLLTGVAWTYPIATDNVPEVASAFLISMLPAAIAVLYWVYQLSLFRIEKNFGLSNPQTRFSIQLIHVAIIAFLGMTPYYYSSVLQSRIGNLVSMKTMKQDLKNMESFDFFVRHHYYQGNNHDEMQQNLNLSNLYETARLYSEAVNIQSPSFSREGNDYFPFDSELEKEQRVEYSDQVLLEMAEKAFHSFNKYSPQKITDFKLKENPNPLITEDKNYKLKNKCERNIRLIMYTQYGRDFFGDNEFPKVWTCFLLALSILLFIFMRVETKTFLMAGVTGFVLTMGIGLVANMSRNVFGFNSSGAEILLSLVYFGTLLAMGSLAYASRNTRHFGIVRQISLILLSIGVAFSPTIVMLNFFREYSNDYYVFYWLIGGLLFAWGMWNTFFAAKMRDLYSNPKQN